MHWKAQQFYGRIESSNKETYGFKSRKCLHIFDVLIGCKNHLMSLIKNFEFYNVSNTFQGQLSNDIK